jgi:hypothetical protein
MQSRILTTAGLIVAVFVCLLNVPIAMARESRGWIVGRVVDPGGAVVCNADVIVTNLRTGVWIKLATNESGSYTVPLLRPGRYKIEAEYPGFKRFTRQGVKLRGSSRLQVDVRLEAGPASQNMTMTEGGPMLKAADGSTAQLADGRRQRTSPLRKTTLPR